MAARSSPSATVELLASVWDLYRELDSASARMSTLLGVSGPERLTLRIVETRAGTTPGRLAQALNLHKSTVSALVKRLEGLRLLKRRTDPSDRRVVFVELTAAGRRLIARDAATIETALRTLVLSRGDAWRRRASETLRALSAAIGGAGQLRSDTRRR